MKLTALSVGDFIQAVASNAPAPGGGSVSAFAAANGAALLCMVAKLTIGKKKYAEFDGVQREILEKASVLMDKFVGLIDTDTEAFNKVSAVFSMPKDTEEEKKARQDAMQEALKHAAKVPLEVMENCLSALKLTFNAVGKSNTSAASDLGVAALGLGAGVKGAWLNVKINLTSIKDEEFVEKLTAQGESILESAENLAVKIYETILSELG